MKKQCVLLLCVLALGIAACGEPLTDYRKLGIAYIENGELDQG